MKTYLSLAFKEIKAQKVTAALILIAVILSGVMTTAVGESIGILQAMRISQASSLNGDRYATFHQLTEKQMRELSDDSRLADVGSLINTGSLELGDSGLTLFVREYLENALKAYPYTGQVKEGRLPEHPGEIALPEDALSYLPGGVKVGSTVTLHMSASLLKGELPSYKFSYDFKVCGILKSNYIGYASSGTLTAIAGEGTSEMLLPGNYLYYSTDFKTKSLSDFTDVTKSLARKLGVTEDYIQYNWILLNALGVPYAEGQSSEDNSGFSYMILACVLVGLLVLLAAGLVIYNILKISVSKRIREYGTLRAMGGERRQIYRLVSVQLLILCGVGIPIGMCIGVLSSKGILSSATAFLNPDLFMADSRGDLSEAIRTAGTNSALVLPVSAAVTLIFAMLAAFPAARYASRVSPTVAMAGQAAKIRRRFRKVRRIRNFESYYARLNLKRGRARTAITILSLVMSITVFVALQSFSALLDTSRPVQDMHLGDYAVTNEDAGISPAQAGELKNHADVSALSTASLSIYVQDKAGNLPINTDLALQPAETFQIAGLDDGQLLDLAETGEPLTEEDRQDLLSGKACFVKNPIPTSYEGKVSSHTSLQAGNRVTVNGKTLRILGAADHVVTLNNNGFPNGVQLLMTQNAYVSLTGKNNYGEIYPTLREGADAEAFERCLDDWCAQVPGSHYLSYRQTDLQLQESFEQINLLCWTLIVFIGLIGILNIINTVYSNIHTRVSEIGMQRAIGMSAAGLYKTFLWEGAYYSIFASVIGAALGYVCTIFINAAAQDTLTLSPFPVLPVLEAAALSMLACLLATALPLRSISQMNIVESIEAAE